MSDPTHAQPSPEEMQAYLEQLRESDPAGLVAEAFNLLATGAQVKLGRPDARALIDSIAGMVKGAGGALPPELSEQMNQGIAQLQIAQVQAERDAAAAAPGAGVGADGVGDAARGDAAGAAQTPPPDPAGGQRMTDRLWVPGRDPGPPSR